jgi:Permuted papain-like amidase enzyme, YaeF/YiiX, C92 family
MSCTLYLAMAAVAFLDAGSLAEGLRLGAGGNPWGPAATRTRVDEPVVYTDPAMKAWDHWGRQALREGDVVFRLGDVRVLGGIFPLSQFIARATGSRFSHTGIVAVERGEPVVYDCTATGIQRRPFAFWMQDNIGAFGLKRLKPEQRSHIPGALAYCRRVFEAEVPFDRAFQLGDDRLYCTELVEKSFRSTGLALSEPVRIGDWKNLGQFPLTTVTFLAASSLALDVPITLDQPVYVPGDDRQGVWASHWLDTVAATEPPPAQDTARPMPEGLGVRGDASIVLFVCLELRSVVGTVLAPLTLVPH